MIGVLIAAGILGVLGLAGWRFSNALLDSTPRELLDINPAVMGVPFLDVDIPTELGSAPAWFVDGDSDTWVVAVHGKGGSRCSVLGVLPVLHDLDVPTLMVTYRGDVGAPASPDGLSHLGATEWRDVAAAVRWCVEKGAARVVLYAQSMGAMVTARMLDEAPEAGYVSGVIWDSPLVDWRAVVELQARYRRLPRAAAWLALAVAAVRVRAGYLNLARRRPRVAPRTLILHGVGDEVTPIGPVRQVVDAHSSVWPLALVEFDAGHGELLAADRELYEDMIEIAVQTAVWMER